MTAQPAPDRIAHGSAAANHGRSGGPVAVCRLSAIDMTNLAVEAPDTPMHVAALLIVDGRPLCDGDGSLQLAALRDQLTRQMDRVPELHRRLSPAGSWGYQQLWIDDLDFRIDRHVTSVAVPAPGDEPALLRLTEDLLAPRLDRAHPLWRIWFVTGLSGGRVAVVIALHHAIGDGAAAMRLLTTLLAAAGNAGAPGDGVPLRARPAGRPGPARAVAAMRGGWRTLGHTWNAPRTSITGPIGARRRLAVVRLDLATATAIAHATGTTVNDVVLDVVAGGLRALLISRGEPVTGVHLHASVPVGERTTGRGGAVGNRAGIVVVRLPIGDADPRSRLAAIRDETRAAKRGQPTMAATHLLVWLARTGLMRRMTRRQHLTNTVVSNLVGPKQPITVLGTPVLELIPIGVLAGNLASAFLAFSYAGTLTITVRVDADRFPDLDVLTGAITDDWQRLTAGRGISSQHLRGRAS
jgi:WS/DGAT/MGAT family acyltransferase